MAKLFMLLLLLALCNILVSAQVKYYVDCGSMLGDTDGYGNVWQGDYLLVSNGETQSVQSSNAILDTLRVFTTGNKNCYNLEVNKGERVLVRASFNYGNYDGLSSPPTFDLQFDGNFWTTVETSNDEVVTHEVTYVVKRDVISVCVAQTKSDQFPFISALEVHSMDSDIYKSADSDYALLLKSRVAYGADAIIRLPTDYDRIWTPAILGRGQINFTDDSLDFAVKDLPIEVLRNAITTSATSDKIILASGFPSNVVSVYISMYFSEPTEVTKTRSFKLYVDNQEASDTNIEPPYGNVEHDRGTIDVSSNTTLSLVSTTGSELPPLINAMELFYVSKDQLTNGTHADDLEALALLQTTYSFDLQDYSDPCLPEKFTWDWVECNNDSTPRVTALHLGGAYFLTGSLPNLSSMTGLKTIDLHNNAFTGVIPDYFGTLPNLKELNLADNLLTGSIPTSISKNKNIKLNVTGNSDLCTSGKCDDGTTTTITDVFPTPTGRSPSTGKKKKKTSLILGTTIPSGLLASAFVGFLAWVHHKRKKTYVASTHNAASGHVGGGKIDEAVMNEIKVNIDSQVIDEESAGISQQHSNAT